MEKTFNMMQRAFNFGDVESALDHFKPLKQPMVDSEFLNYLDAEGRLVKARDLRLSVYQRGIDPALRKVAWKHILNVYPAGLTAKERISYMKQRAAEYMNLRQTWQDMIANGDVTEEIHYITNMVRKDVLRTDRTHKFYAGSDDNKNVVSLFNILITYALNHPSVSYCQGMSDLASPILVTMRDEAHAYVCFCALMQRLKPNFQLDGKAMSSHFQQLSELLQHYDPQFFMYLKSQGADDLLFCYRWLLLELKREFAFDDALRMLEVLWSSIPPAPPETEMSLYEERFTYNSSGPRSPHFNSRENPYIKVRAIRKQNSASSIRGLVSANSKEKDDAESLQKCSDAKNDTVLEEKIDDSLCTEDLLTENTSNKNGNGSVIKSDFQYSNESKPKLNRQDSFSEANADDTQDYLPMTTSITRELRMELENLNRQLPGSFLQRSITVDSEDLDSPRSPDGCHTNESAQQYVQSTDQPVEEEAPESWTSDDLSGIDQICRLGSSKKSRKKIPGPLTLSEKNAQLPEIACSTPEDQCEFDTNQIKSVDIPCNGEIFENEESEDINGCSCHLKSVIPIRLVHSAGIEGKEETCSSDSSDSLSESSGVRTDSDEQNFIIDNIEDAKQDTIMNPKELPVTQNEKNSEKRSAAPNSSEDSLEYSGKAAKYVPPPPSELGGGNPFMLFLCLTLLLQHRDMIMKSHMDYNEMAMHFDKMVRKHNVHGVLHQARALYRKYLQTGWQENNWGSDLHV